MNKRKFAFSWGRKMFFGFSFPISLLIGVLYFRSFILPESLADWAFVITSYIGHFGLLNVLCYFLLFSPVIFLMPTYYASRFWSLFLILILNLLLLLDAISFSSFHLHLYNFLSPEIWEAGYNLIKKSKILLVIFGTAFLLITVIFWIRGELIWRHMQGRFSNPIKNWYIFLIIVFFATGKLIYFYQPIDLSLARVLPLHFDFGKPDEPGKDNRKFFYPSSSVVCKGKSNPNIIMLIIKEWSSAQASSEMMPKIGHLKDHAISYKNHLNVNPNSDAGLFTLSYALPSTYRGLETKSAPVFLKELDKRNYEIVSFDPNQDNFLAADRWIENRSGEESRPFFLSLILNKHPFEMDEMIDQFILKLEAAGILRNSEIILTGAYSGPSGDKIPLFWFRPQLKSSEVSHLTTPYDVVPSIMNELWGCKNVFNAASTGKPLSKADRKWIVTSQDNGFKVYDFENNNVLIFSDGRLTVEGSNPRIQLIFSALKRLTRFNRP